MRILLISSSYAPVGHAGHGSLSAQVVDGLRKRGHVVDVLTAAHRNGAVAETTCERRVARKLSARKYRAGRSKMVLSKRWRTAVRDQRASRRQISSLEPHVVVLWGENHFPIGAAHAAQASGVPTAYVVNDSRLFGFRDPSSNGGSYRFPWGAMNAMVPSRVTLKGLDMRRTAVSSLHLKWSLVYGGIDISDAEIIYPGIPIDLFPFDPRPGVGSDRPIRILYRQLSRETTDLEMAMKVVHQLAAAGFDRAISATVLAENPQAEFDRVRQIADLGPARIDLISGLVNGSAPRMYREHDLLIYAEPPHAPATTTIHEAMASGIPIVSTCEGPPAEVLRHGENALLFQVGDTEGLSARLSQLIVNPELGFKLASAARAQVEKDHTLDRYVEEIEELLRRTAGRTVN